ncbi:MAG: hypothetical protein WA323_16675 [Candidatus Nitrosopolaris sp.]
MVRNSNTICISPMPEMRKLPNVGPRNRRLTRPQPIDGVKTITEEGSKHQIKAIGESEE